MPKTRLSKISFKCFFIPETISVNVRSLNVVVMACSCSLLSSGQMQSHSNHSTTVNEGDVEPSLTHLLEQNTSAAAPTRLSTTDQVEKTTTKTEQLCCKDIKPACCQMLAAGFPPAENSNFNVKFIAAPRRRLKFNHKYQNGCSKVVLTPGCLWPAGGESLVTLLMITERPESKGRWITADENFYRGNSSTAENICCFFPSGMDRRCICSFMELQKNMILI